MLYLHHDQQGSTRLLTGSTGKTEATYTYDAYGNKTGSTGTSTTPMGYDAQYTNADTGLIYLRAREYDPATAQFLSVDPDAANSHEIYEYGADNPVNVADPTGLQPWSRKVKEAVGKCGSWKAWHSKKSPFYGNQKIYESCTHLLSIPTEVYGSRAPSHGNLTEFFTGVGAELSGVATAAAGTLAFAICTGAEIETDAAAHCAVSSVTIIGTGLFVWGEGEKKVIESGVPQEFFRYGA